MLQGRKVVLYEPVSNSLKTFHRLVPFGLPYLPRLQGHKAALCGPVGHYLMSWLQLGPLYSSGLSRLRGYTIDLLYSVLHPIRSEQRFAAYIPPRLFCCGRARFCQSRYQFEPSLVAGPSSVPYRLTTAADCNKDLPVGVLVCLLLYQ